MQVAIIQRKNKWFPLGLLTKWFTGCRAYHIGFYNERTGNFFDVGTRGRRMKPWSKFFNPKKMTVEFFPCRVNEHYLTQMVRNTNKELYGWFDYFLFFFRKIGFKVRNINGIICSEMVNRDLHRNGESTPWKVQDAPPSPCDFLRWYHDRVQTK